MGEALRREIARVHRPTPREFHEHFVRRNIPVVLTGITEEWKAIGKWTPEFFQTNHPSAKVVYTAWESSEPSNDPTEYYRTRKRRTTTLGNFIEAMKTAQYSRDYVSQFPLFNEAPQLKQDIEPLQPYMNIPGIYPAALQKKLKKVATFWLGPAGIVTPVHFDSAHNLLVQIYGHKKLILIPPVQSKLLYYPSLHLGHVNYSPVDIEHPDYERFPQFRKATLWHTELTAGEILFIPVRWWHYARALEPTISLNFWWFSVDSLRRMWHPYLVYKMSRLFKGKATDKRGSSRI
jgi:[protein]-arginine 3-hydroxylase / protease